MTETRSSECPFFTMNDFAQWHDPESPLRIEYSLAAMEQVRQRAVDGVKALPRTGLAVGGLLLGERAGAKVRILNSAELICSHAFGPSFLLTPHEKAQGRELVQTLENPAVVGWYISRTRGEFELAEADIALYRELFPAQWQITLMLQAGLEGPARAAFFFSGESGELKKGAERELGIWIPGIAQPVSEASEDLPLTMELPGFALPENSNEPVRVEVPVRSGKLGWVMSWVLTAVAALAVGAAAFEVQNTWLAETPVQTTAPGQIP